MCGTHRYIYLGRILRRFDSIPCVSSLPFIPSSATKAARQPILPQHNQKRKRGNGKNSITDIQAIQASWHGNVILKRAARRKYLPRRSPVAEGVGQCESIGNPLHGQVVNRYAYTFLIGEIPSIYVTSGLD